jgi:hypothetical protein
LNVTSTVSPFCKPWPFAVTLAPGNPELGDSVTAGCVAEYGCGCGVLVADAAAPGVGVIVAVACPRAVAGIMTSIARTTPRIRITDPISMRCAREKL